MDDTAHATREMYREFPYPSREVGSAAFNELRNLFHIFSRETAFDFSGKSILDAGTGTGHRLAAAAGAFPEARYTAIDFCQEVLAIARQHPELQATRFEQANLMEDLSQLGKFDIILSMGVLHHLPSPVEGLKNLVGQLADGGMIFLYVYGSRGAAERMRRKQIVSTLLGGEKDFETGLQIIKDLGFDTFEYGWNAPTDDQRVRDGLIVDAYLNVHETTFTSDSLAELLAGSGLSCFATYGISTSQRGYLFDTSTSGKSILGIPRTDPNRFLSSDLAKSKYEELSLKDQYRVIDLWYQPNGYTVIGFKDAEHPILKNADRLQRNALNLSA